MAVDKDFVIKNGIQVNENLIYGDADTDRVGIGTTQADKKLVVIGNAEVSTSLAVGTTISAQRATFTGIVTTNEGVDIGVGGTFVSIAATTGRQKVGIGSTLPVYTLDVIGPVSTGITATYIYGDLEVTGNIKGTALSGQISAGGTVGFTNVTVDNKLDANNAEVYTKFNIEEVNSNTFRYLTAGDPPGIGFTQNADDPELYLQRAAKYEFHVDTAGFPFYIKTQPTADLNNQYNDGVVNNGAQAGIVTFKVPFNAPNILYYQASNTAGMGGTIYINNDYKEQLVGVLTVTQYLDSDTQADFENIFVSGIGTINNLKGPQNFSVSSGILTVRQDQTALIGISTGADRVSLQEKSNNVNYQVPFTETLGIGSNYQNLYVDSENGQMRYNPSTNILTVNRLVGNVSGVATGADDINVDSKSDNTNYQLIFSDAGDTEYTRMYIDSQSSRLVYNPSTNTLSSTNIIATTVTAGLAGTATNANFINVDEKSDNTDYQVLFSDNQGAGYQRPYIDSQTGQFKYNPSTNTLTAANIAGAGDNITNLDGGNISQGVIDEDRLPNASTTAQGVVQLDNTYPPTSTSTTRTATTNVSKQLYDEIVGVIPNGTRMIFYQTAAPTGWTKVTTSVNNRALRVVSGEGGGSGGTSSFTSTFASRSVPLLRHNHGASSANNGSHVHSGSTANAGTHNHTGSTANAGEHNHEGSTNTQGNHDHSYSTNNGTGGGKGDGGADTGSRNASTNQAGSHSHTLSIGNAGSHNHTVSVQNAGEHNHTVSVESAGSHNHTITIDQEGDTGASMNFAVQYLDVIICQKDNY